MIVSPTKSNYPITQGYGERPEYYSKIGAKRGIPLQSHSGQDLATPMRTKLYAPIDGKMKFGLDPDGWGLYIKITGYAYNDEGHRREVVLAHLDEQIGTNGGHVKAGDFIGYSGNSGNSSGAHCHWALRRKDKNGNTLNYEKNCGFEDIFNKGWILKNESSQY